MSPTATVATFILSTGTLVSNVLLVISIIGFLLFRRQTMMIWSHFRDRGVVYALAFSVFSFFGAIIYSQITGFPACPLCWTQRILMALVVIMLSLGVYKKYRLVIPALVASGLGAGVALYQYVLQYQAMHGGDHLPCPAISVLPSCDKIYILEYGYITIPMIALSAFAWIIFLLLLSMRRTESVATATQASS